MEPSGIPDLRRRNARFAERFVKLDVCCLHNTVE